LLNALWLPFAVRTLISSGHNQYNQSVIANRLPTHARLTLAQQSNLIPITAALYDAWRVRSLSLLTGESYTLEREFVLMLDWLEVKPEQTFLDVGTSTGNYAMALARTGARVTAIDISKPMLEKAQTRIQAELEPEQAALITLEQANAEALPYPDSSFDGVVLGATLNEFNSTRAGLLECARVVKPGGRIFMMYLRQSDSGFGRLVQALFELGQIRFPNRETVRATLQEAGLERTRAEMRRAVTIELFSKTGLERANRAATNQQLTPLPRAIGKPQNTPLGETLPPKT
jgi:ubiquinone/menaquinone biosynthesis C-methylase UbiE